MKTQEFTGREAAKFLVGLAAIVLITWYALSGSFSAAAIELGVVSPQFSQPVDGFESSAVDQLVRITIDGICGLGGLLIAGFYSLRYPAALITQVAGHLLGGVSAWAAKQKGEAVNSDTPIDPRIEKQLRTNFEAIAESNSQSDSAMRLVEYHGGLIRELNEQNKRLEGRIAMLESFQPDTSIATLTPGDTTSPDVVGPLNSGGREQ